MRDILANIRMEQSPEFTLEVELSIPGRGVTVLFGPSGAGKTTILRLLAGLEGPRLNDNIEIRSGDHLWHQNGPRPAFVPAHKREIGYVFQQPQLFPHLDVLSNLQFAQKRKGGMYEITLDQVSDWLDLKPLLGKRSTQLSGGESQRVAIARVLLNSPQTILMDEPLGAVDVGARYTILPYLESLHRELSIPIVYVTHSPDEMNFLADHVVILEKGSVVEKGSIYHISSRSDTQLADSDNAAAVVLCRVISLDQQYGLASLAFGDQTLIVKDPGLTPGAEVRTQILSKDVSITLNSDHQSSILNTISCEIESISIHGAAHVVLRLVTGDQHLLARITRKSMDRLKLSTRQKVYAQIKSVALLTERYDH